MRFGIFDQIEVSGEPLHQLYKERLEYVKAADQAGFWCYHKSEHHMIALDAAPSIGLFFAAAAQHTERIRFGSLVYLLPFHHPIRLAEEVSMLDHLTNGRLELGVGRGVSLPEHELWGLEIDRIAENFDESFAAFLAALQTDILTFHGNKYHFEDVPIMVRPMQQPNPPLWYPGNIALAAKLGMNTVAGGPLPVFAEAVRTYRSLVGPASNLTIGGVYTIFIAPTDEEAKARVRPAWDVFTDHLTPLFRKWNLEPPKDPTVGGDVDRAMQANLLVAGSPATVKEFVNRFEEQSGSDYFIAKFTFGDVTHAEAMRSMQLFAEQVM